MPLYVHTGWWGRHGCRPGHYGLRVEVVPTSNAPGKTWRPSEKVRMLPDALFEPSFARNPWTTTVSPTFRVSLVNPFLMAIPGGRPEKPQVVTLPFSSFTST